MFTQWQLHDRIFHEEQLYDYVGSTARERGWEQTLRALPMMKECHEGQLRKGAERIPYINHPLMMAAHAIWLGIAEDRLICTCLLHDVCEDCNISAEELPVDDIVREAVRLLTKESGKNYHTEVNRKEYYGKIAQNSLAAMVKVLDRCNNISQMASSFSQERMREYASETEIYILPFLPVLREECPEYSRAISLLWYHMIGILQMVRRV